MMRPRLALEHVAGGGAGREERAAEVHVEDASPLVPVGLGRRFGERQVVGVHEDVDCAEFFDGARDDRLDFGLVGGVDGLGEVLAVEGPDLVGAGVCLGLLGLGAGRRRDADVGAGFGEGDGDGAADGVGGADDERGFAFERELLTHQATSWGAGRPGRSRSGRGRWRARRRRGR